jgi:hypothetical protein
MVTKAGVTLKHQAKGFMVPIMKGLMMVGGWSDVGFGVTVTNGS